MSKNNLKGITMGIHVKLYAKKITFYCPLAVFIAQVLVGLSKQLKQIFQIEHNIVKNPNWLEAIYECG